MRTLTSLSIAAAVAVVAAVTPSVAFAAAPTQTWYVQAGGPAGDGSKERPMNSLVDASKLSREGDTLIVLPVDRNVPALDGGIVLKRDQKLIGGGAPVLGASAQTAVPRITNTVGLAADAVTLAPGATVQNLVIEGANRAAIYGRDAVGVTIEGNDISQSNRLCHDGFIIGPFQLPASIAVRTAVPKLPNFVVLNNGWAAVMLDYTNSRGNVDVRSNRVHDTACGDGIDLRTFGSSSITAAVDDNTLTNINLGIAKLSVLAMGLQSKDSSTLTASLNGNSQTHIADPAVNPLNATADSEGVFVNPVDNSTMQVSIDRNTYRHGGGHFSANGLEYVTTTGSPRSDVTVSNSSFDDVTGDVIESYNLSPDGARHHLTLENVDATRSHFPAAVLNPIVPANLGSCLIATGFGRTSDSGLTVRDSTFGQCSADGIGIVAYVPEGAEPASARVSFDIRDTSVSGAAANGLNVINVGNLAQLHGRVETSDIRDAQQSPVRIANYGTIDDSAIDLGGGKLGSTGANCISSTGQGPIELSGVMASAKQNWWGGPAAPSGRQLLLSSASVDTSAPLATAPRPTC